MKKRLKTFFFLSSCMFCIKLRNIWFLFKTCTEYKCVELIYTSALVSFNVRFFCLNMKILFLLPNCSAGGHVVKKKQNKKKKKTTNQPTNQSNKKEIRRERERERERESERERERKRDSDFSIVSLSPPLLLERRSTGSRIFSSCQQHGIQW